MKAFKTKKELFKYLSQNKTELLHAKKSAIKFSDGLSYTPEITKALVEKAAKYAYDNNEKDGLLTRTIILNTYNWLDSADDVHLDGVFGRSISNGSNKAHLHDHIQTLDGRVGKPSSFEEKSISWRELGLGKTGMTQALFMVSNIKKSLNESIYNAYLNDEVDQHSVGMQYVNLALAMNDDEYPTEKKVWDSVIGKVGNRAKAEDQGYFFAVSEAKLFEGSAVLFGANELTPTLGKSQPDNFTVIGSEKSTRILNELARLNKNLTTKI